MFDAKSILEALVKGAGSGPAQSGGGGLPGGLGGLGDILGQLGGGKGGPGGGLGGLGDILGQLGGGSHGGGAPAPHAAPAQQGGGGGFGGLGDILGKLGGGPSDGGGAPAGSGGPGGGGLGDILGELQKKLGGGGPGGGPGGGGLPGGLGGLGDILGQVFGQARDGVKEGAGKLNEATGASDALGKLSRELSGKSPEEIMAKLKELVGNSPLGAGAALGGLGALVLGTKAGRSLAGSAAKLGALALIGGLAYKALQNYQAGKPIVPGMSGSSLQPAPAGSGFEPAAVTNDTAILYIRAMIAAAAADGRIDAKEQQAIMGGLKQAGLDAAAEEFLANELNNPATAADLAAAVTSPEQAVQVYTAARIAIDVDERGEAQFLADLADALGIDRDLAAHIESQAVTASA